MPLGGHGLQIIQPLPQSISQSIAVIYAETFLEAVKAVLYIEGICAQVRMRLELAQGDVTLLLCPGWGVLGLLVFIIFWFHETGAYIFQCPGDGLNKLFY